MNALLLSAIMGVVMMFSGIALKQRGSAVRSVAIAGVLILLIANIAEMNGYAFFDINTARMMHFDQFALLFTSIALFCTLIFFLLSGRDMEKVGSDYADYFALIFFILCGIILVSSFESSTR